MTRTLFAVAIAGLFYAATPVTADAALLLPHPGITTASPDYLTDVRWRRCWRDSRGTLKPLRTTRRLVVRRRSSV